MPKDRVTDDGQRGTLNRMAALRCIRFRPRRIDSPRMRRKEPWGRAGAPADQRSSVNASPWARDTHTHIRSWRSAALSTASRCSG